MGTRALREGLINVINVGNQEVQASLAGPGDWADSNAYTTKAMKTSTWETVKWQLSVLPPVPPCVFF
jgi:hypothetical protein